MAFGSKILDAMEHIDRLRQSAEAYQIDIPWRDEEIIFELSNLLALTKQKKSYLRLVVTRGSGMGLVAKEQISPNKIIYCLAAKLETTRIYEQGLSLKRSNHGYTSRGKNPKSTNYIESIKALNKAHSEGFDDILWTNSEGEITEAATANVFLLAREGDLIEIATPPATSGLLLGITRKRIISLLESAKIKVTERVISLDEIARFDEGFLCSTVRGIVPICRIDKHRLHTTRRNSVFRHINRLYMTWVETQIGYQVNWNTGDKSTLDRN